MGMRRGRDGGKVEKVMREYGRGKLKSGGTGKRVTSRRQAVAIGLSEARRAGENVSPPPGGRRRKRGQEARAMATAATARGRRRHRMSTDHGKNARHMEDMLAEREF